MHHSHRLERLGWRRESRPTVTIFRVDGRDLQPWLWRRRRRRRLWRRRPAVAASRGRTGGTFPGAGTRPRTTVTRPAGTVAFAVGKVTAVSGSTITVQGTRFAFAGGRTLHDDRGGHYHDDCQPRARGRDGQHGDQVPKDRKSHRQPTDRGRMRYRNWHHEHHRSCDRQGPYHYPAHVHRLHCRLRWLRRRFR